MRRILAILLCVFGILLAAYPKLKIIGSNYKQKQIVESWKESMNNIKATNDTEGTDNIVNYMAEKNTKVNKGSNNNTIATEAAKAQNNTNSENISKQNAANARKNYITENMEGMLSIKKIKLYLPILKGASKKNLDISVCSVADTGNVGDVGNYCIAGHRSHSSGVLFNRLNELDNGDEITVTTSKNSFTYVVYEKLNVAPDDIKPLEPIEGQSIISLITCDYSTNPWRRIIVHGKLKK